jgi:hypothetical protein
MVLGYLSYRIWLSVFRDEKCIQILTAKPEVKRVIG